MMFEGLRIYPQKFYALRRLVSTLIIEAMTTRKQLRLRVLFRERWCLCFGLIASVSAGYAEQLKATLSSQHLWFRFIEYDEPVKTVEEAATKVEADKIAKSIVMIDSQGEPLLAIVSAGRMVSHRKLKQLLSVRDVRLATAQEVLQHSGYPVGGVPPFNKIKRVILDQELPRDETVIVGGGDINKLVEIRTADIITTLNPTIADISKPQPPEK